MLYDSKFETALKVNEVQVAAGCPAGNACGASGIGCFRGCYGGMLF